MNLMNYQRSARLGVALSLAALSACSGQPTDTVSITEPLFPGTGTHHRPIVTASAEAQAYFDQGLAFLFAFNHDEAIRSFRRATEIDPDCAMAWWGIAYANGPHINNAVVPPEREAEAFEAATRAAQLAENFDDGADRALIMAVTNRYASPQLADRTPLDAAYAEAMAEAYVHYPEDGDVGALYAEALMDLHPWDLWEHDGTAKEWTPQIVALLEDVVAANPDHPLALHLYIHTVEASDDPARGDEAANRLRNLMPGLGHMVHMPSHIDVLRGRWQEAIEANSKAITADAASTASTCRTTTT